MKILQITPEAPGKKSGGQIGVAQTIKSIWLGNEVDYVGPEIEEEEYKSLYRQLYILQRNDNTFYKIIDLFKGVTSTYYRSWLGQKNKIDFASYDVVIMDFTKFDFCLAELKGKRLITRVHNIESEYAKKDYQMNKNIKNYLVSLFSKKAENNIVQQSSTLVFLHIKDEKSMKKIYDIKCRCEIVPVCVEKACYKVRKSCSKKLNMLITGSMWFGGNYEGTKWVIENVLPRLGFDYELTIAGNNPNPQLIELCKDNTKIKLIVSPEDMTQFFEQTDIVLAPVFDGAGMKVKVAEALSYGKPVIGTNHAFIGYEIEDNIIYKADNLEDFVHQIQSFAYLDTEIKHAVSNQVSDFFEKRYSIERSMELWKIILMSN